VILLLAYILTVGLKPTPSAKPLTFLFGLNGEGNLPAWYSGTQLLLIGLSFLLLSTWLFREDERVAPLKRLFRVAGAVFVYLSADEIGQIHENFSRVLQSWHWLYLVEIRGLAAIGIKRHKLHGGSFWIPLFAVIGIALLVWLWPQIVRGWQLWRREILLLGVGFAIMVFGATVIETIGNFLPAESASRLIEVGVEETFEMFGASVMLYAIVRVVASAGSRLVPYERRPNTDA
jgi:hypothetical protein